jgi:methyl-accepting chemotaxis protein
MNRLRGTIENLASGDLRARLSGDDAALSSVRDDFNAFVSSLEESLGGVSQGSQSLEASSETVEQSSRSLSQAAADQAGSLEEFSAALEQILAQVNSTNDHAGDADKHSQSTATSAREGVDMVQRMSTAMGEISESSRNVESVIQVIEQIAFQTNLLALNAAVEAARAGDAGKGFAVVADEVRGLALRSAQAAQQTSDLISESIERVERGTAIASEVESTFGEIAGGVEHVSSALSDISTACSEQTQGINQMVNGVTSLRGVSEGTAAHAQQLTDVCEQTRTDVASLRQHMSGFTFGGA